jgi:hypothetical protein
METSHDPSNRSLYPGLFVLIPEDSPLLAITLPNNGRMELPQAPDWGLRFDGPHVEGMEITFDASTLCL